MAPPNAAKTQMAKLPSTNPLEVAETAWQRSDGPITCYGIAEM
jgi:hypothetical protein